MYRKDEKTDFLQSKRVFKKIKRKGKWDYIVRLILYYATGSIRSLYGSDATLSQKRHHVKLDRIIALPDNSLIHR